MRALTAAANLFLLCTFGSGQVLAVEPTQEVAARDALAAAAAQAKSGDLAGAAAILLPKWRSVVDDTSLPTALRVKFANATMNRLFETQRFSEAETVARAGLALLQSPRNGTLDPAAEVEAIFAFSAPMLRTGKAAEAEMLLRRAEAARQTLTGDTRQLEADIGQRLSVALVLQGKAEAATDVLAPLTSKVLAADFPNPARGLVVTQTLGGLYIMQGRPADAIPVLEQMRPRAMELWAANPRQQAEFLEALGEAYRATEQNAKARHTYRESLELIARSGLSGTLTEATLNANLGRVEMLLGNRNSAVQASDTAVALMDKRIDTARTSGLPVAAHDLSMLSGIAAINLDARYVARGALAPDARRSEDAEAFMRLQRASALAQPASARANALDAAAMVSLSDAMSALRGDEALLVVLQGTDSTHVMGVTRAGLEWHRLEISSPRLCERVAALRRGLTPGQPLRCLEAETGAAAKATDAFDVVDASALYQDLFAPLGADVTAKPNWMIVATGSPTAVPMGVLPMMPAKVTDAYGTIRWLAREKALSYLPSVGSFVTLRTERPEQAQTAFVGIGAPCIGKNSIACTDDTPAATSVAQALAALPADTSLGIARSGGFEADPKAIARLPALPRARTELAALASLFPGNATILVGPAAREAGVRGLVSVKPTVVAFATHGLVAGEYGLTEPALVLSPPAAVTAEDDGLLTASEVAALDFEGAWVILSACNMAGIRDVEQLDAFQGFARAFFSAGARALLISQFEVQDDSAVRLTTRAVEAWKEAPKAGRGEALRKSVDAMLSDTTAPQLHHPRSWASMVLVGTPD